MEFSGVLLIIGIIYLIRLCLKINTKQNKNAIDISNIINSLEELKAQKDSKELDIEKEEIEEFVNDIEIEPDYKPSSLSIKEEIYIESVLSPKHEWEEVPKEQTETVEQEEVSYLDNNESKSIIQKEEKSFFEKYPDIEKFVGENLINKIGIVILVLGLGFLVKYAIDKNWINEIGRVAIGVISASILIATAHKLRKDYKSFSSVLIGGGLALLYFTISGSIS